jgi:hypothetical protein
VEKKWLDVIKEEEERATTKKQDTWLSIINNKLKIWALSKTTTTKTTTTTNTPDPATYVIATFEWFVTFVAYRVSGNSFLMFLTPNYVALGWLCSVAFFKTGFYYTYFRK